MIRRNPVPHAALVYAASRLLLSIVILFCCFARTSLVAAQTGQQTDDDEVLRVSTNLIVFPARIRDKKGQRPNGLTNNDLRLKDPDHATNGLYLAAGVDRIAIIFALDESGSLREIINEQREGAVRLYERFGSRSSIAVLHFAEMPQIASNFARNSTGARSAFEVSARSNQHTAIFDAAAKAVEMFAALPRVRSERRIVILISDGLDNLSKTRPDTVIDAARDKTVSFYVIHLPLFEPRDGRLVVRAPAEGFRALAEKTGGKYFLANDAPLATRDKIDLAPIFGAIEDDLRSQYLIGFYVADKAHDGKLHKVWLSLPAGLEYQIGGQGYENAHKFTIH